MLLRALGDACQPTYFNEFFNRERISGTQMAIILIIPYKHLDVPTVGLTHRSPRGTIPISDSAPNEPSNSQQCRKKYRPKDDRWHSV